MECATSFSVMGVIPSSSFFAQLHKESTSREKISARTTIFFILFLLARWRAISFFYEYMTKNTCGAGLFVLK